jgi:5-methylcytosine-specific restriction endonuclease McrA
LNAAREVLYQRMHRACGESNVRDVSAETSAFEQQQADALALLAETARHHGIDPGAPSERYQVVVHVEAPGQSALESGEHVSAERSRRLECDASRVVMRHGRGGRVMEVSARTRTIPPALRRALYHRDGGCRFSGCGGRFGQGHHIRHWAQGGPTKLSNLAMLCRRHHRAVHEEGYQAVRDRSGELRFYRPDGKLLPDMPCPPRISADPAGSLRRENQAAGLVVDTRTALPLWSGERLDVGYAIDVLHSLVNGDANSDTKGDEPVDRLNLDGDEQNGSACS